MEAVKISVIVPAYNMELYVEKCLDSIVVQNSNKIEIIVVDDGSVDRTGEICDSYAQKYNNINVLHKKNGGLSDARNQAIKIAKGEFLMFIDSDDYVLAGVMMKFLDVIEKNENVDVIIGRHINFDLSDGTYEENRNSFNEDEIDSLQGEDLLNKLLSQGTYDWYPWLNIVRKEYLLSENLFFKTGRYFEDAMWVPDLLLKASKIKYLDFPFYVYSRNRTGAITTLFSEKAYKDKIMVCEYTKGFIEKNQLLEVTARRLLGNINRIYVSLLADCWKFDRQKRNTYLKQLDSDKNVLLYSNRMHLKIMYYLEKIIGLKGISYIFYKRAEWVRKQVRKRNE